MDRQCPLAEKSLPNAGWGEYVKWFLGRRRRFIVRENSMVPTLMPGDMVLAEVGGSLGVGDIAVVRWGRSINPQGLLSDQLANRDAIASGASSLLLVKRVSEIFYDGGVYLISDNAHEPNARDSRHFGVIEADRVIGRVTSRLASSLE